KPVLIDPHSNCAWIGVEMLPHQRGIAQRRSEEQVGSRALCDQESRNFRTIPNQVLRRGRIVILIECVDFGAVVQQKSSYLDCTREMQGPLAIAALAVDERWIACDQACELLHHTKIGSRPNVDPGAPRNERRSLIGAHLLQHAEPAFLPAGPSIEVCTMCKQEIEQLEILARDVDSRAIEAE